MSLSVAMSVLSTPNEIEKREMKMDKNGVETQLITLQRSGVDLLFVILAFSFSIYLFFFFCPFSFFINKILSSLLQNFFINRVFREYVDY